MVSDAAHCRCFSTAFGPVYSMDLLLFLLLLLLLLLLLAILFFFITVHFLYLDQHECDWHRGMLHSLQSFTTTKRRKTKGAGSGPTQHRQCGESCKGVSALSMSLSSKLSSFAQISPPTASAGPACAADTRKRGSDARRRA